MKRLRVEAAWMSLVAGLVVSAFIAAAFSLFLVLTRYLSEDAAAASLALLFGVTAGAVVWIRHPKASGHRALRHQ